MGNTPPNDYKHGIIGTYVLTVENILLLAKGIDEEFLNYEKITVEVL